MKLLLVDHEYHRKTNSIGFLRGLLERRFAVTTHYVEGTRYDYRGDAGAYDVVALFQVGEHDIGRRLRHRNIVFFPMYDHTGVADEYTWKALGETKIVAFCRAQHEAIVRHGLKSLYAQYYPEAASPPAAVPRAGVFFWQRKNSITWPQVKLLLGNRDLGPVHFHKEVDPGQVFVPPTSVEERAYRIRYSSWFPRREGFWEVVAAHRYFIAPRVREGIGLSFLEAMAMGRTVIAADKPTMNEYITSGVNGYLFDPDSPTMVDFADDSSMTGNIRERYARGLAQWKRSEEEILDFIMPDPGRKSRIRTAVPPRPAATHALRRLLSLCARVARAVLPGALAALLERGRRP